MCVTHMCRCFQVQECVGLGYGGKSSLFPSGISLKGINSCHGVNVGALLVKVHLRGVSGKKNLLHGKKNLFDLQVGVLQTRFECNKSIDTPLEVTIF